MITDTEVKPPMQPVASGRMKALVYHGPGKRAWEERPKPALLEATDAIVRLTTSTICGTDLHILKGDVPSVTPGRILGHEGIGIVEDVGTAVSGVHVGNRVLISCITCGKYDYCKKGYAALPVGGWILNSDRRHAGGMRGFVCRHESTTSS
jgi:alcohol dehydrogenase